MLQFPVKTALPVKMAKPIFSFIKSAYSKDEAKKQEGAIATVERLRTSAVNAATAGGGSGRDAILDYLALVEKIKDKLPLNNSSKLKLTFQWNDAFTTYKSKKATWEWEKACMWYNLAAIETQLGAVQDRSSDAGITIAFKHFQLAATIFEHIKDHLVSEIPGKKPPELSEAGLNLGIALCKAQGQACYYEKAKKKGMKPGVLAKLALSASELYNQASPHAKQSDVNRAIGKNNWGNFCDFQRYSFQAAAEWQQAKQQLRQAEATSEGYGEEIAWLQRAQGSAQNAVALATSPNALAHKAGVAKLVGIIRNRLTEAVQENNTIYIEPVPSNSSLSPIAPHLMVKPAKLPVIAEREVPVLFSSLVPKEITDANIEFRERMIEEATQLRNKAKGATEEAKRDLASKNLPAAVEAQESVHGLPDSMWSKIRMVQAKRGMEAIESALQSNQAQCQTVTEMLFRAEGMLAEEARADQQCRSRYGKQYEATPSGELTSSHISEVRRLQSLLAKGQGGDKHIQDTVVAARAGILNLSSSREVLSHQVPDGSTTTVGEAERMQLAKTLKKLGDLLVDREPLLDELTRCAEKVDVTNQLVRAGGVAHKEEVFAAGSKVMEEARSQVNASLREQGELMSQINRENDVFNAARSSDDSTARREAALRNLQNAVDVFEQLLSDLKQGSQFYDGIFRHAEKLMNDISGYVAARDCEREDELLRLRGSSEDTSKDEEFARNLAQQLEEESKAAAAAAATPAPAPAPAAAATAVPPYGHNPHGGYAPPAGGYAPPAGGYAPPAGHAPPAGAYGAPAYGGAAPPSYGAPPSGYAAPAYGAPAYGAPAHSAPQYGSTPAVPVYAHVPAGGYAAGQVGYGAAPGYNGPASNPYAAPPQQYGAPPAAQGYAAPAYAAMPVDDDPTHK